MSEHDCAQHFPEPSILESVAKSLWVQVARIASAPTCLHSTSSRLECTSLFNPSIPSFVTTIVRALSNHPLCPLKAWNVLSFCKRKWMDTSCQEHIKDAKKPTSKSIDVSVEPVIQCNGKKCRLNLAKGFFVLWRELTKMPMKLGPGVSMSSCKKSNGSLFTSLGMDLLYHALQLSSTELFHV